MRPQQMISHDTAHITGVIKGIGLCYIHDKQTEMTYTLFFHPCLLTEDVFYRNFLPCEIYALFADIDMLLADLGGLVVSVLATGPTGYSVAGSSPTEAMKPY
jgi:hypothetical protein